MNKIEKAISDCKLKLENLRRERVIIISQIEVLEDELANLQAIQRNNGIPNDTQHKPVNS